MGIIVRFEFSSSKFIKNYREFLCFGDILYLKLM